MPMQLCHILLFANTMLLFIMLTHPCNLYPIASHFYLVKLGFNGVYIHMEKVREHLLFYEGELWTKFLLYSKYDLRKLFY